ncbi:MAG: 1-(5-phosphoribosyl)-5-[(5-phosphoribosylamino)methylideneamino]imidazole-4-carboxamide isomerase [Bacteroidota bacterium]
MIRIIPAIDILNGKCVRLTKGDFSTSKVYYDKPLEIAQHLESFGIRRLHIVDLDGARGGAMKNLEQLKAISRFTSLYLDYSGGIRSENDVIQALNEGADQVAIGSLAVEQPDEFRHILKTYKPERIILSADFKDRKIMTHGWLKGQEDDLFEFVGKWVNEGLKYMIATDIELDGMLQGVNHKIYKDLKQAFPKLNIIASGGFTKWEEIDQLEEIGIFGLIIGKAIYEGKISLEKLAERIKNVS